MALGATAISQGLSTPFKADSPAVSTAADTAKGVQKVVKAEVSSPLQDMSKFFAGIDKNIREVATKIGEQTGITKLMAKIMGKDLDLSEKEALANRRKRQGANIDKAKTPKQEQATPLGAGILASLKDAFENLIPQQTIGELGKILLIASGAAALIALADKFQNLLAPVLKFFFETLIPGFQELNKDILASPTGYLGVGGLVVTTTLAIERYGAGVRGFFVGIGKNLKTLRADMAKEFARVFKAISPKAVVTGFKRVLTPITRIGAFIATLSKTIGSGAATILAKIPGVASIARFGKLFVRFLGPVGLVIQAFVGLFTGISRAIETFKETGSVTKAIGSFFAGLYDSIVAATINLLFDLVGFVIKKLGFQELGEKIQSIDFSVEGILSGVKFVIDKIKGIFAGIKDGFYTFINGAIKIYNKIPFVDKLELLETEAIKREREEGIKGSEGTNTAEQIANEQRAKQQGDKIRLMKKTSTLEIDPDDYGYAGRKFDVKAENAKKLKAEQEKLAEQQAALRSLQNINAINNSKGGDTYNQSSVHTTGEPNSDHNDMTQKHLAYAYP